MSRNSFKKEVKEVLRDDLLGTSDWKRSKLGFLTGGSVFRRNISSSASLVGSAGYNLARGIRQLMRPGATVRSLPTDSQDPQERFRVAAEMYGRSEGDLKEMQVGTSRQAFVFTLLLMCIVAWTVHMLGQARDVLGYITPFTPFLFAVPIWIRACLRAWQIRNRSLIGLREFIGMPGQWIPPISSVARMIALVGTGVGAYMLMPDVAFAQQADDGTGGLSNALSFLNDIPTTDVWWRTVGVFMGGVGPVPVPPELGPSPWTAAFGEASRVFNTTLLAAGGAMMSWHTLIGITKTAQEGEVLGKRWNTWVAPFRVTFGLTMLVPGAAGFSTAQIFVLWVALWGSSMANTVWSAFLDTFSSTTYLAGVSENSRTRDVSQALFAMTKDDDGRSLVLDMFERQVCLRSAREVAEVYIDSYNAKGDFGILGDWTPNVDGIGAMRPEHMTAVFGAASAPANAMAFAYGIDIINPADTGDQLSLHEVGAQRVNPVIGLKKNGQIAAVPVDQWPAMIGPVSPISSQPRGPNATAVQRSSPAQPVVSWNYGPLCGRIVLNFSDLDVVQEFIKGNKGDDAAMTSAAQAIHNSATQVVSRMNTEVMPHIQQAARVFSEGTFNKELDTATKDALYAEMFGRSGSVTLDLARAYAGYIAMIEELRASTEDGLFSLVENSAQEELIEAAKELGWASSGAFYVSIAQMNAHNMRIAEISVTSEDPDYNRLTNSFFDDVFRPARTFRDDVVEVVHGENGMLANLESAKSVVFAGLFASSDADRIFSNFDAATTEDGWMNTIQVYINNFILQRLMYPILEIMEPEPYNALLHIIDLGHYILGVATILLATAAAIWAAGQFASLAGGLGKLAKIAGGIGKGGGLGAIAEKTSKAIAGILKTIAILLIFVGLMHAYAIALIPYTLMLFFAVGMLILLGEAIVATPIWALNFVRFDGDEVVESITRPGVMIIWNLFLRPTLAIFGLILSFAIFSAAMYLLNETFEYAARAILAPSKGFVVWGILALLIAQTYLHYQLAIRCFSLITQVPDRVARWFGQGGENLNEEGENRTLIAGITRGAEERMGNAAGAAAALAADADPEAAEKQGGQKPKSKKPGKAGTK